AAGGQLRLHRLPGCALPVAVHAGVLEELPGIDHALELVLADEVVVLGMALARARRPRGERDRQAHRAVARQAGVDDAGFARARGRGDDEQRSAHGLTQGSAPGRGPGRSGPSAPPPPASCGGRRIWIPAYWLRG